MYTNKFKNYNELELQQTKRTKKLTNSTQISCYSNPELLIYVYIWHKQKHPFTRITPFQNATDSYHYVEVQEKCKTST